MTAQKTQLVADSLRRLMEDIREEYQRDSLPWVIGYSGGKDSTLVVQLTWCALAGLPPGKLAKPVHVISTDTRVENPFLASWVGCSLEKMNKAAKEQNLPIRAHRLEPTVENSFWVNVIGKGYPAPSHKFRWCTERMKIAPSNAFMEQLSRENGGAVLLMGTRKMESQRRERELSAHGEVRDRLRSISSLPGVLVYSPIEDCSTDDVWSILMQSPNPWGQDNRDLLTMYGDKLPAEDRGAAADIFAPIYGDYRFSCWVCPLVDQRSSINGNANTMHWAHPLVDFREKVLGFLSADSLLLQGRKIKGATSMLVRKEILRELLLAQESVRRLASESRNPRAEELVLISLDELEQIRRLWFTASRELDDTLPGIYEFATGRLYPGGPLPKMRTSLG